MAVFKRTINGMDVSVIIEPAAEGLRDGVIICLRFLFEEAG